MQIPDVGNCPEWNLSSLAQFHRFSRACVLKSLSGCLCLKGGWVKTRVSEGLLKRCYGGAWQTTPDVCDEFNAFMFVGTVFAQDMDELMVRG